MNREIYIGVDVSKNWLDLAYYDGVTVDWKQGHIRVDNKQTGFSKIGKWLGKLKANEDSVLFCLVLLRLYTEKRKALYMEWYSPARCIASNLTLGKTSVRSIALRQTRWIRSV